MPYFYQPFLSTCDDEVFAAIEDSVIGGAVALNILIRSMAVHGLEMHEAVDSLVALVLCFEGVLEDLVDIKLIKIRALY